ncbi:MAG: division/cell wall cluster transcriptional repressor MraZ [Clostridiales bacterium]|jgi:MraZ protein|nr:division/cell wall cluster transcriptional repressor MraZ [Clostridiales bacterium]
MPELLGQYWHTLDQKNRLSVPSKLRMTLGESFVLCLPPNGDRCIFAYSNKDWEDLMVKLNENEPSKDLTRRQRFIRFNSDTAEVDKQGRITISKRFVDFAHITKEVFILGAGRRMEIWAADEWGKMYDELEAKGEMPEFDLAF